MEGDKRIEKYHFNLKNTIGYGSYATVYQGKVMGTNEEVAVKVIDKRLFLNSYNLKNIQSEIDIMKQVNHQNIVKLYDIYQTTNNMYIITQLCQDKDLYHLLQSKQLIPENQAKKYLKEIMKGVKYLHSNGIIHRDLKPANILLKNNICKISDFGFAKSFGEDDDAVMKSIVGTPLYMSPQLLKRKKYTTKSDLWSIGLIYYQMLHGKTPWPAKNQLQLINGIYSKPIIYNKDITDKSKDFIRRCLQINQEDRMSWEEAFQHPLLKEFKKQSLKQLQNQKEKDKENNNPINIKKYQCFDKSFEQKTKLKNESSQNNFKKNTLDNQQFNTNLTPKCRSILKNVIAITPPKINNDKKNKTFKEIYGNIVQQKQNSNITNQ